MTPSTPAGPKLRARREALGASQTELAALLGIRDRTRITAWENGRQNFSVRVDADLYIIEQLLDHVVDIITGAIREGHSTSDPATPWLIDLEAITRMAARADITLPASVAIRLAQRIQTNLHSIGITTTIGTLAAAPERTTP